MKSPEMIPYGHLIACMYVHCSGVFRVGKSAKIKELYIVQGLFILPTELTNFVLPLWVCSHLRIYVRVHGFGYDRVPLLFIEEMWG